MTARQQQALDSAAEGAFSRVMTAENVQHKTRSRVGSASIWRMAVPIKPMDSTLRQIGDDSNYSTKRSGPARRENTEGYRDRSYR
jgi:hypothetical protein